MSALWQDVRFAARTLAKNKGFLFAAVITLALGIGANTAIFSVIYGVMLRPLSLPAPERIFQVALDNRGQLDDTSFTFSQFQFVQRSSRWCDAIAALTPVGLNLSSGAEARRVNALHVSSDYFRVLGIRPLLGRDFLPEDDRPSSPLVAILSHGLWTEHFGADAQVIGRTIQLNGNPYVVIGVMPAGFDLMPSLFGGVQHTDLWTPLAPVVATIGSGENLDVIARLKPDETPQNAHSQLGILSPSFSAEQLRGEDQENRRLAIYPYQKMIGAEVSDYLWILLGAVSFVLLIACANVANLLLARGAARNREIAVRTALGATRGRLVRQLLTESLLLGLLGGSGGILLASVGLKWLVDLAPFQLPRVEDIHIDGWVFLFAVAAALGSGILFGLMPAFHSTRTGVNSMLKADSGRATRGPRGGRLSGALVISEIALSFVLLVGAALLSQTFLNLLHVDPGFQPHGLVSAEMWVTGSRYRSTAELASFYRELLQRLKQIPGVQEAAVVSAGQPLERGGNLSITIDGEAVTDSTVEYRVVTPDYFRALRVSLLRGRDFTDADVESSQPVAIVNEAFVQKIRAGREPLGSPVRAGNTDAPRAIVGITSDVRSHLYEAENPTVFIPAAQADFDTTRLFEGWFPTHVMVRASGDPALLAPVVEKEIRSAGKDVPVGKVRTMDQWMSRSLAFQHFMMVLLALFAALALVLAAVGIYGVMAYAVMQRTQEMGIRVALGAEPMDVLRLVIGDGLRLTLTGLAVGLAGALALRQALAQLLFGVQATDLPTLAAAVLCLGSVALLACYLPARRATRVDPLVALRYE